MAAVGKLDALTNAVFEVLMETTRRPYTDDERSHFQRALTRTFTRLADTFPNRSSDLWELFDQGLLEEASPLIAACLYGNGLELADNLVKLWVDRRSLAGESDTRPQATLVDLAAGFLRQLSDEFQADYFASSNKPGLSNGARLTEGSHEDLSDSLAQAGKTAAAIGTAQGFQFGDSNFQQNIFYDVAYVAYLEQVSVERERKAVEQAQKVWERNVERLLAIVPPWPAALPSIAEVDPYGVVGVSMTKYAHKADPYVSRDRDSQLDHALTTDPFVLVIGDSKTGKSRTAFESARRVFPEARLLVPRGQAGTLGALFELDPQLDLNPGPVVLWLDDLERYLSGVGALDVALLDRLGDLQAPVIIIATMRSVSRDRVLNSSGEVARTARQVLGRATTLELVSTLSQQERKEAVRLYPTEDFERGIGEQLVAAPLLEQKYHDGREATPAGWALVQAAIDLRRAGIYRPIPQSDLRDLYAEYLPGHIDPADQLYRDGLAWAREPVASEVALLSLAGRNPEPSFIPFDYIVAYADGEGGGTPVSVPPKTWEFAITKAAPTELLQIGQAASTRDNKQAAIAAFTRAANSAHLPTPHVGLAAMYAAILLQQGEPAEAERYWRIAADAEQSVAAWVLSSQLASQDPVEAENYLRQAADDDVGDASFQLGMLLRDRDPALAEHYLRKATDTEWAEEHDVISSLLHLTLLVRDRDSAAAERYLQRAADVAANIAAHFSSIDWQIQDRGSSQIEHNLEEAANSADPAASTDAAVALGMILRDRDPALAERYLRKAADAGDDEWSTAALQLSLLLRDREPASSEHYLRKAAVDLERVGRMEVRIEGGHIAIETTWFDPDPDPAVFEQDLRTAADDGDAAAALELGQLLRDRNTAQSEHYLRRAADEGVDPQAFLQLAFLLEERDSDEALHWYRKAADAELPLAAFMIGAILEDRGDEEAKHWNRKAEYMYRMAADRGQDTQAMFMLALLLNSEEPPNRDEARRWYQKAADAGHPAAMYELAASMAELEPPDVDGARRWYQKAADAGDTDAMYALAALMAVLEPPDVDGARRWYQKAADAGNTGAMVNLAPVLATDGDLVQARVLLQKAADAGATEARDYAAALDDDPAVRNAARANLRGADDDTDAWNFLGVAALRAGARDEARAWWTRSRDAGDLAAPLLLESPDIA